MPCPYLLVALLEVLSLILRVGQIEPIPMSMEFRLRASGTGCPDCVTADVLVLALAADHQSVRRDWNRPRQFERTRFISGGLEVVNFGFWAWRQLV